MSVKEKKDQQYFRIGSFEGPLDLLLFLIKKSEINIYDIPIAEITDQYLEYLTYAIKIDLENVTEFYHMASTLLYIKSRMLLPIEFELEEEYEDPRRELVDRLIEYQRIKKLSSLIAQQEAETDWMVVREKNERVLPFQDEKIWEVVSSWDLYKTFVNLVSSISSDNIIDLYEEVTVNEKITLVNELLEGRDEFYFSVLLTKKHSLMEVVCSFFAILEMVKTRRILVYQNKMFGDIVVKRNKLTSV